MNRLDDTDPRVLAILLASLHDFQPGPAVDRRNPLSVRQPAASSWAPSGYELCPDCDLGGNVKRGKHTMTCPRCKGYGCWPVDGYDLAAKPLSVQNGGVPNVAHAIRQVCDMTLPELDRALARLARAAALDEDAQWLALQKQARHAGQPWATQLVACSRMLPPQYRLALRIGLLEAVGAPADPMLVEVGLAMLGEYLPVSFRAPGWAVDQASLEHAAAVARDATARGRWAAPAAREARDGEIRRLDGAGWSGAAIERRLGVSRRTVARVLDEREAA